MQACRALSSGTVYCSCECLSPFGQDLVLTDKGNTRALLTIQDFPNSYANAEHFCHNSKFLYSNNLARYICNHHTEICSESLCHLQQPSNP